MKPESPPFMLRLSVAFYYWLFRSFWFVWQLLPDGNFRNSLVNLFVLLANLSLPSLLHVAVRGG